MNTPAELPVPVLLLVHNRPDATRQVFRSIRSVQPTRLFVAADGPRSTIVGEARRCAEARQIAVDVDWTCEVTTLFREENLGLALAVSGAISWFFENVNEGIILEDDCVPTPSFYRFCTEILRYYQDEPQVMHISGNSFQYGRRRGSASYYFSKYPNVWGWATWRRAWNRYDFSLRPSWELHDTWSTQWQLSIEKSDGVSIVPNVNMVRNIGFGAGATHTTGNERPRMLKADELPFPLIHPAVLEPDRDADVFTYYAHHRMVAHLRLVWLYQAVDRLRSMYKSIKRGLRT